MKKIIFISLLLTISLSLFAQKTDFTTYDVIAKADDVTIIVKDNDYRMIIGSVKKPKLNMLMGYSKDQAINRIDCILNFSKEDIPRRIGMFLFVVFCFYLLLLVRGRRRCSILRLMTKIEGLA